MASPAQIVTMYLRQAAVVSDPAAETDWPCYYPMMPDVGNDAVSVGDTAGVLDGRLMRSRRTVNHPGIGILIRAKDYDAGWAQGNLIQTALDQMMQSLVTLSLTQTVIAQAFTRTSDLAFIGQEPKNRRWMFSINGVITI